MSLTVAQIDRVIEMAWEDRTPFEAITYQFALAEKDVSQKHLHKRNSEIDRFKCTRQRSISGNKISKR